MEESRANPAHDNPVDPTATHLLIRYPSQLSAMLFRLPSGIQIGMRKQETVIWGEFPNTRKSHLFLNGYLAEKWLAEEATKLDMEETSTSGAPILEVREAEGSVILAPDSLDFPGNTPNPRTRRMN